MDHTTHTFTLEHTHAHPIFYSLINLPEEWTSIKSFPLSCLADF